MNIDLTMCSCATAQILLSSVKKRKPCENFNVLKKPAISKMLTDLKTLLPPLTHFHAIYFPLAFVAARACLAFDLTKAHH